MQLQIELIGAVFRKFEHNIEAKESNIMLEKESNIQPVLKI